MAASTQNRLARAHIHEQLDSQRWQASQAAREVANWERAARENALERMAELVAAGRYAEARRIHLREVQEVR